MNESAYHHAKNDARMEPATSKKLEPFSHSPTPFCVEDELQIATSDTKMMPLTLTLCCNKKYHRSVFENYPQKVFFIMIFENVPKQVQNAKNHENGNC